MAWRLLIAAASIAMAADQPKDSYQTAIQQWRTQREATLKADDGWLTVVGLYWLKPGENRVGSNSSSEVPLPRTAPENAGTLVVKGGKVVFKPSNGAAVTINGKPATQIELKPDTAPNYDILATGRVKFYVIQREDRLGVRVKDNDSAARREFTGLRWYPIDPPWKVQATFVPWDAPRKLTFDTAVGLKEQDESPGYVTFQREGKQYRLEPVLEDNEFWFVMRDQSSGKTTYSASRFLYAPLPKTGIRTKGTFELDFNKAENPPCVFTDFATCPLPPPQNRLPLVVNAGELMYSSHH